VKKISENEAGSGSRDPIFGR